MLSGIQSPKWIVIQLLKRCNLRCRMCYEWGETGSYHGLSDLSVLDFEVLQSLINETAPYRPYYGLFGGEPLLYDRIGDVIDLITSNGCKVDIPTNGTLLEKKAEEIIDSSPTRLWVSLDGPPVINDEQRGQGVYDRVIRGIEKIYRFRQARKRKYPFIGVTFIVTPSNHMFIESLFLKYLDLNLIDHLSIEFQLFATDKQYQKYCEILKTLFNIDSAPCAKGLVQNPDNFKKMDFKLITKQMLKVRERCEEMGIYFIAYPKTIKEDNIRNFFLAQWYRMEDAIDKCGFPWLYSEVSANGSVSVCHTFYDLPIGNVYEESLLKIWKGKRIKKIREYLSRELFPICTACSRYYADPTKH